MAPSKRAARRWAGLVAIAGLAGLLAPPLLGAQTPRVAPAPDPLHVSIPFLANATKPSDLDFEGGECDIDPGGTTMACQFEQVFLTVSPFDAGTCLVTTNHYEQTFQKDGATRWVSRQAQGDACGVEDVTTLLDEGRVKWTLETRKVVTRKDASPACRGLDDSTEILSWQNLQRPLPCKFVRPGAISP
jgi:hypothetical protein